MCLFSRREVRSIWIKIRFKRYPVSLSLPLIKLSMFSAQTTTKNSMNICYISPMDYLWSSYFKMYPPISRCHLILAQWKFVGWYAVLLLPPMKSARRLPTSASLLKESSPMRIWNTVKRYSPPCRWASISWTRNSSKVDLHHNFSSCIILVLHYYMILGLAGLHVLYYTMVTYLLTIYSYSCPGDFLNTNSNLNATISREIEALPVVDLSKSATCCSEK